MSKGRAPTHYISFTNISGSTAFSVLEVPSDVPRRAANISVAIFPAMADGLRWLKRRMSWHVCSVAKPRVSDRVRAGKDRQW
jgi:hypothetical protein